MESNKYIIGKLNQDIRTNINDGFIIIGFVDREIVSKLKQKEKVQE